MPRRHATRLLPAAGLSVALTMLSACASVGSTAPAPTAPPTLSPAATPRPTTSTPRPTVARATTTTTSTTTAPTTSTTMPATTLAPPPEGGTTTPAPFAPTTGITQARPNGPGDPFAAFDATIASSLFGRGALTVSVAVAKDGTLLHEQVFGTTNPYTGEAAGIGARFRIASVSKTLLAAAILRLVEQGRLQLDETVLAPLAARRNVALGDPAMATITVRQLLAHTSSFPEYQRTFFGGDAASCEDAAVRGLGRGLLGPPGTVYRYSNLNYCLLGLLVEDLTGHSYEQVVTDEVLEPLGIDDMRVAGTFDVRPGDVVHPTGQGRVFMEALGAAGSWIGTAGDLVRVVDALDPAKPGIHLLSATSVAAMTVKAPVVYPHADSWYGLGLIVWDNGTAWGHTGTVESARTMVFHGADGVTWAILVNGPSPSYSADLRKVVDKALATVTSWPS